MDIVSKVISSESVLEAASNAPTARLVQNVDPTSNYPAESASTQPPTVHSAARPAQQLRFAQIAITSSAWSIAIVSTLLPAAPPTAGPVQVHLPAQSVVLATPSSTDSVSREQQQESVQPAASIALIPPPAQNASLLPHSRIWIQKRYVLPPTAALSAAITALPLANASDAQIISDLSMISATTPPRNVTRTAPPALLPLPVLSVRLATFPSMDFV